MKTTSIARSLAPAALAAAALVAPAQPALAAEPDILPAGVGCADFNLGISSTGGKLQTREFVDRNGNVVRIITAGKGVLLTYTNYGSDPDNPEAGESITFRTDGSVSNTVVNPDGSRTVTATGHNGIVMFPTDIPAGPSTTQYLGRVVYTISTEGVWTLVSSSGTATDVCAALAG